MALLQNILYKVRIKSLVGKTDVEIAGIAIDSRKVQPGGCFIAIRGVAQDGHQYIDAAIEKGAIVVVCESMPEQIRAGVNCVQTDNAAMAAGIMAHALWRTF